MLPAILGFAGSSLAKAGLLGSFLQASPFLASALGSGIGSLLQGGTTDDALQAGLLGGVGGAIGSKLGTSTAMGGDPSVFSESNALDQALNPQGLDNFAMG